MHAYMLYVTSFLRDLSRKPLKTSSLHVPFWRETETAELSRLPSTTAGELANGDFYVSLRKLYLQLCYNYAPATEQLE